MHGARQVKKMKKSVLIHWPFRASLMSLVYHGYRLLMSLMTPPNRQPVRFSGSMGMSSFSCFSSRAADNGEKEGCYFQSPSKLVVREEKYATSWQT
ncbi:hypothetical protein RRG08_064216 [Elysia crispata]|uniref:Uncharacterized protein n=1 Tax=Elysia crispata TaxID=231223 RepID=A0AAE0YE64_9GAST|nr:hypothetical protein RRG08_064216 [Elysia crispata]